MWQRWWWFWWFRWSDGDGDCDDDDYDDECDDDGDGEYFYDKVVMVRTMKFAEEFGLCVGEIADDDDDDYYYDDDRVRGWSVALKFYERGGCRFHDVWSTYLLQLQDKK